MDPTSDGSTDSKCIMCSPFYTEVYLKVRLPSWSAFQERLYCDDPNDSNSYTDEIYTALPDTYSETLPSEPHPACLKIYSNDDSDNSVNPVKSCALCAEPFHIAFQSNSFNQKTDKSMQDPAFYTAGSHFKINCSPNTILYCLEYDSALYITDPNDPAKKVLNPNFGLCR